MCRTLPFAASGKDQFKLKLVVSIRGRFGMFKVIVVNMRDFKCLHMSNCYFIALQLCLFQGNV